jgi:hypothetical protein
MAGPVSSIVKTGGCDYVYDRDDWYFASVNDPATLRTRMLEWHTGLAVGIEQFAPTTSSEAVDFEFMRSVVSRMRELIDRVCGVEQARWLAARLAEPDAAADNARRGDIP